MSSNNYPYTEKGNMDWVKDHASRVEEIFAAIERVQRAVGSLESVVQDDAQDG